MGRKNPRANRLSAHRRGRSREFRTEKEKERGDICSYDRGLADFFCAEHISGVVFHGANGTGGYRAEAGEVCAGGGSGVELEDTVFGDCGATDEYESAAV